MCDSTMGPQGWHTAPIDDYFRAQLVAKKLDLTCSPDACIRVAQQLLSTQDVTPVDQQGAESFPLLSPSRGKVVQFRVEALNQDLVALVDQVYGHISPTITMHTDHFALAIYVMDVVPGIALDYFEIPELNHIFPVQSYTRTVTDLATFIARAVHFPQPTSACRKDSWTRTAPELLRRLSTNKSLARLAPDLATMIASLRSRVHLIDALPLVLTHADLGAHNIFVNPADGHVTGVIDWRGASIEAFGMSIPILYEWIIGGTNAGKFCFFTHRTETGNTACDVLERCFWETFCSSTPSDVVDLRESMPAIRVAIAVAVLSRQFKGSMIDQVEESRDHMRAVEYARGIIPVVLAPSKYP